MMFQFYRLFVVQLEAAEAAVKEAEQIRRVTFDLQNVFIKETF